MTYREHTHCKHRSASASAYDDSFLHRFRCAMNDTTLDEPQLRILLAAGESLQAPAYVLRCMSSCACGLPADAAEWDLSGLLLEGQPIPTAIVKAWLAAVSNSLKTQPDRDYAKELSNASQKAKGLYQLLQFADAVGSRPVVLHACLTDLETLQFDIKNGEEQLELEASEFEQLLCIAYVHLQALCRCTSPPPPPPPCVLVDGSCALP